MLRLLLHKLQGFTFFPGNSFQLPSKVDFLLLLLLVLLHICYCSPQIIVVVLAFVIVSLLKSQAFFFCWFCSLLGDSGSGSHWDWYWGIAIEIGIGIGIDIGGLGLILGLELILGDWESKVPRCPTPRIPPLSTWAVRSKTRERKKAEWQFCNE